MKISSMLLVVITLLAVGSAFWLHTQRSEALNSATAALADKAKSEAELKDVKQKLIASEKARKSAEGLAEKNEAMINVLKGNAETNSAAMKKGESQIAELTRSLAAIKDAKAAADKSAGGLRSNVARLMDTVSSLQDKVKSLTSDLASSKAALTATEAAKSQLETLLAQEREARKAAEARVANQQ